MIHRTASCLLHLVQFLQLRQLASSHTGSFSTDSLVSEISLRTSDASSGLGEDLDGLESEEEDFYSEALF